MNDPRVRIEPILAEDRLYDDRVGSSWSPGIPNRPLPKQLFPVTATRTLNSYADPYHLGDVVLFVHNGSRLWSVDPFTGRIDSDIGQSNAASGDLTMTVDGHLLGLTTGGMSAEISTADATAANIGDDGIMGNPMYRAFTAVEAANGRILVAMDTRNNIYSFSAATGTTDMQLTGVDNDPPFPVTGLQGVATGLATIGTTIYGVTDAGQLFRVDRTTGTATVIATLRMPDPLNPTVMINIPFSGLSRGPANVEGAPTRICCLLPTTMETCTP